MADLTLQGVSKAYPSDVHALHSTDLTVQDGQLMVLVGPSGCGKSTLLKIIAGLEAPSTGSLYLDGQCVNQTPPQSRDVAMVFQNYALYPHLTVRENLGFGLKMRGMAASVRLREVAAVAELLQLTPLLDRKPGQLSGGQQQRVALGRAIVRRPKLFLLDEPFSNLDATLRSETRTELLKLHRQLHATTILVTHDQVEAMTMADVLVVLKDGYVQQVGPPLDVYRSPANTFVAQFIGSPPMNLLPVTITAGGASMEFAGQRFANPMTGVSHGTRLTLGLRAEHIRWLPGAVVPQPPASLSAKLDFLEPLGHETIGTCTVGEHTLLTRMPPSVPLSAGQEIHLALDLPEAAWFHPETGVSLTQESILPEGQLLETGSGQTLYKVGLQRKK